MKIDVTELRRVIGREAEYRFTQQIEPLELGGDSITFSPAEVDVKMLNSGESITGYFKVHTEAQMVCSRCLEPFSEPVDIEFSVTYQYTASLEESEPEGDEDVVFYEGDLIDVSDDVRQQVVLALPMKPICTPDCKGMCASCGKNLNNEACDCVKEDVDVRLAVLKDLLKK